MSLLARVRRPRPRLSRPLRRRRLRRTAIGAAVGLVWSTCLLIVLAQTAILDAVNYSDFPWWLGVLVGIAVSAGVTVLRASARRLRIRLVASRLAVLAVAVVAVQSVGHERAEAQGSGSCVAEATVVDADGRSGPSIALADSTRANPVVIDPDDVTRMVIDWNVPEDASLVGREWWIRSRVAGFERDVAREVTGEDGTGVYEVDGFDSWQIPPGVYQVWGELDGVCPRTFGYVRILGSPLDNRVGLLALAGLLGGLGALGGLVASTRFDQWSFTTADDVTISIVDPVDGEVARDALTPGQRYELEVEVDFPDPQPAYLDLAGPVEVMSGVFGATSPVAGRTIDPRLGSRRARLSFDMPPAGSELQLNVDFRYQGNLVQSVQVREAPASSRLVDWGLQRMTGREIGRGIGTVVYKSADFGARQLANLQPVDGSVTVHGTRSGTEVEVWLPGGDQVLAAARRHRVAVAALSRSAQRYRDGLEAAIAAWHGTANLDEGAGALVGLAAAGADLRSSLFGDGATGVPVDGVIALAHDPDAMGAMTFPWAGLYEGQVPLDRPVQICTTYGTDPEGCDHHRGDIVCPNRFWGLRHELAWPDGWIPSPERGPSPLTGVIDRLRGRARPASLVPNRLDNDVPVPLTTLINTDLLAANRLPEVTDGRAVVEYPSHSVDEFIQVVTGPGRRSEVVYCLSHGSSGRRRGGGEGYALLVDRWLGAGELAELASSVELERGPIVMLNACNSGVIGLDDHHGLLDVLRRLGARAVIVTESRVTADVAARAANDILGSVLDGARIGRAVLEARRRDFAAGRLTMLAYSYYGPPGLRLTTPVPAGSPAPPPPSPASLDPIDA